MKPEITKRRKDAKIKQHSPEQPTGKKRNWK